ncbi:MAG: M20/M25/M40 family metallo-hydrolase [Micromonosporaceae bacterium]|nr:M20/M25/M40 family metallo-hydrolase [Micromonosporaceae bacterium]
MSGLEQVLDSIDPSEVTGLALALGQIDSPSGHEHAVSDYLVDWCAEAGLAPRRVSAFPGLAANVVARVPGQGGGSSLLFNSHLDTVVAAGDATYFREPDRPELHTAWRSGDDLVGVGVVNDKGPMAGWLVAAAAIRRSGVRLPGDLVLTMVTGEIGHEPVLDELSGPPYHGKDHGSRFVATHGALADYALVAETTAFRPIWVEPGKAFFRLRVLGRDRGIYTPYLRRPYPPAEHPNAVVRAAPLIPLIEQWAYDYQERTRRVTPGGEVVPKVNLGAIRAGHPSQPILSPVHCDLYLDVRLPPGQPPMDVREELRALARQAGVEAEVECYLFRRGYQAVGAEPLVAALQAATRAELGDRPGPDPGPEPSSMWRDLNVWNELGVPAVTFGPGVGTGGGNAAIAVADLIACARIYARTALEVCARPRR